jgi:hypothetical protein
MLDHRAVGQFLRESGGLTTHGIQQLWWLEAGLSMRKIYIYYSRRVVPHTEQEKNKIMPAAAQMGLQWCSVVVLHC